MLIRALIILLCLVTVPAHAAQVVKMPRLDGQVTPLKLYGDWKTRDCPATIILSHGLGGNENGLAYIGKAFARKGLRAVVVGHRESSLRYLKKFFPGRDLSDLVTEPSLYTARHDDLTAAIKYVNQYCHPRPFLLGGHSMGAATTMIEAGASANVLFEGEDRFDAYIAISPQGVGWRFDEGAWDGIRKSVLMITGTEDHGKDGNYMSRFSAFEELPIGRKRFAIIPKATHKDLGGRRRGSVQRYVMKIIWEYLYDASQPVMPESRLPKVKIFQK